MLKQLDVKTKQKDKQKLLGLNEKLENEICEISLPLNFKYRIKKILT